MQCNEHAGAHGGDEGCLAGQVVVAAAAPAHRSLPPLIASAAVIATAAEAAVTTTGAISAPNALRPKVGALVGPCARAVWPHEAVDGSDARGCESHVAAAETRVELSVGE